MRLGIKMIAGLPEKFYYLRVRTPVKSADKIAVFSCTVRYVEDIILLIGKVGATKTIRTA